MTEKDIQKINNTINQYCLVIGTQVEKDFKNIFSKNKKCYLISVGRVFEGVDSIYKEFVIDLIQQFYTKIELIKDEEPKINFIDKEQAVIIFKYHTDCLLRESGEKFGINGVETQVLIKEDGNWKIVHIHYSKV